MDKKKREIRQNSGDSFVPRLREAGEGETGDIIEGYAIVFDRESVLLSDYWDNYREIIHRGAVTQEDLDSWDITFDMYHNRERLLARSNKGVGSLKLTVDEIGVKYEFKTPDTEDGKTTRELTKRGDLSGSSFVFWCDESTGVNYTKDEEGLLIRHVNKIGMIYSMTVTNNPAYSETSVSAREVEAHGIKLREGADVKALVSRIREVANRKVNF